VSAAPAGQDAEDNDEDFDIKDVVGDPRVVVSDSTCLIGLERIQRLELLPLLFDVMYVPPAVAAEFGATPAWLKVRAPQDAAHVAALKLLVDDGEAEAIALAKELGCEVILDDLQARKLAARQNVNCIGLLGVLLRAKNAGRLTAIRPLVEALKHERFFFNEALITEALRLAHE
jgi:predicted nucleic acid-binding protein